MGIGEHADRVYLIDFGLATAYRAATTHAHMPCVEHNPLTGSAPYSSINTHLGLTQSRRDDLESLAYVLIYFLCGSLPWHRPNSSTHRTPKWILAKKTTGSSGALLAGYPNEFKTFLDYARSLDFKEKPDYTYLRNLFANLLTREELQNNCEYDWDLVPPSTCLDQDAPKATVGRM